MPGEGILSNNVSMVGEEMREGRHGSAVPSNALEGPNLKEDENWLAGRDHKVDTSWGRQMR